jgi:hypothetical protein
VGICVGDPEVADMFAILDHPDRLHPGLRWCRMASMPPSSIEVGVATWVATAALVGGSTRRYGASPVASAVGAASIATIVTKMVASRVPTTNVGIDLSKVRLSLSVGDTVLFPLAAGLALAFSAGEDRKKDALVLLSAAALGAGATFAVLASKEPTP